MACENKKQILIIGGGISGCMTADILTDTKAYDVTLVEAHTLMSQTSGINPGRMGLGFHYGHTSTAYLYLQETLKFMTRCSDYLIGHDVKHNSDHFKHKGIYLIHKQTQYPVPKTPVATEELTQEQKCQKMYHVFEAICEKYRELGQTKVYGPADRFMKDIPLDQLKNLVNTDLIYHAVETREKLFDVPRFVKGFGQHIRSKSRNLSNNFELLENVRVTGIERDEIDSKFLVTLSIGTSQSYDAIINCTWEKSEEVFDLWQGHPEVPKDILKATNRRKVLVEVELPSSLANQPSMFVALGSFAMFSNIGNNRALMTYAPVTNLYNEVTNDYDRPLPTTPDEERKLGEEIIAGVASFIPDIAKSKYLGIRTGFVRTYGDVHLDEDSSDFHRRNYFGVRTLAPGWIENTSMKLSYAITQAELVLECLQEYFN